MRRIGVLANTFEPVFGEKAGGHVHFIEVVKRWRNVDVVIFAPEEARSTMSRELPQTRFVPMPSTDLRTNVAQIRNLFRALLGLTKISEMRRCDAILATSHFLPDLAPAFAARPRNVVVCIHHVLHGVKKRGGNLIANVVSLSFQELSFWLVRRFARAVIANDPAAVQATGISSETVRFFQMRHGIEHVSQVEAVPKVSDVSALYLGRLVPSKGIGDLLRAWKIVIERFPTATLLIAGHASATYAAELRGEATALGIEERVRFFGGFSDADKIALLASARVFAFPSKEEGWGIVLAEAMSQGLPCVTYDLPTFRRDFVRGRLAAPIGDVFAFAQLLIRLFDDDDLRRRMGADARTLAQTFSWDEAARIELEALTFAARGR